MVAGDQRYGADGAKAPEYNIRGSGHVSFETELDLQK
jgi:hypothetical protein